MQGCELTASVAGEHLVDLVAKILAMRFEPGAMALIARLFYRGDSKHDGSGSNIVDSVVLVACEKYLSAARPGRGFLGDASRDRGDHFRFPGAGRSLDDGNI